nr:ATP-binding protein [uncultured Cellulosilyticum sp.]
MKDLSLHLLDIAENSIRAGATKVMMSITEDVKANWLYFKVQDNGKGMPEAMRKEVTNPFVTSRTLRKVGMGLPLLAQRCELCVGDLKIDSQEGKGTIVIAKMCYNHIDRVPLGDIGSTLMTLMIAYPHIRYIYQHQYDDKIFRLDTLEIQGILGEKAMLQNTQVILWLKEYVNDNIQVLYEKNN